MDRVSSAQVIAESPLPLELAGPPFSEIRERAAVPQRRGRPRAARPGRCGDHHAQGERHAEGDLGEVARRRRDRPGLLTHDPRPRVHGGPRAGHPALRAADPRHGDRRDGDSTGARSRARGHPGAEGAGRRPPGRGLHQLLPRHAAPGAALPLLLRPAAGGDRLPQHRRGDGGGDRADAALLRLHGREHPGRDPRHRPQPVGGRRSRSA